MRAEAYQPGGLRFAYCYHAYLRWSTHCLRPYPPLARLELASLQELARPHGIHVLESQGSATDLRVLVSLQPGETVSGCASKLKGRTSRWLREALGLARPTNLLSKGYFASTCGKSTAEQVSRYLEQQGEHHGYAGRVVPPVYVEEFAAGTAEEFVRAAHAFTRLQLHLVLATWRRRGVFGEPEGRAVARRWQELQAGLRFALRKVSFVPDHVHVAVRMHPALAPAALAAALMNAAQEVVYEEFAGAVLGAGVERLWQPSAYVGSYGDLASPQVQQYLRNWRAACEREERGEA